MHAFVYHNFFKKKHLHKYDIFIYKNKINSKIVAYINI